MNHEQRPHSIRRLLDSSINGGKDYIIRSKNTHSILNRDLHWNEKVEAAAPSPVMGFVLQVAPVAAMEFDEPGPPPECWVDEWPGYMVYLWVGPEVVARTAPMGKNPFRLARWYESFELPVEEPLEQAELHVELVRVGAVQDPGCSTGETVVGRALYQLRKLRHAGSKMSEFRLTLRRPEGGYGGDIKIAAKLQRRWFHPIDDDEYARF